MRFIELKDGVSVKKEDIIMVERIDTGGTRVTTENTSIESIFPYETILQLLENDAIEENIRNTASPAGRTQGPLQFWRG